MKTEAEIRATYDRVEMLYGRLGALRERVVENGLAIHPVRAAQIVELKTALESTMPPLAWALGDATYEAISEKDRAEGYMLFDEWLAKQEAGVAKIHEELSDHGQSASDSGRREARR